MTHFLREGKIYDKYLLLRVKMLNMREFPVSVSSNSENNLLSLENYRNVLFDFFEKSGDSPTRYNV